MIEHELSERGFQRTLNDEPREDYWLLEHQGDRPDLLVENEGRGWRICRQPRDGEPQGNWIDVEDGLSPQLLMERIDLFMNGVE